MYTGPGSLNRAVVLGGLVTSSGAQSGHQNCFLTEMSKFSSLSVHDPSGLQTWDHQPSLKTLDHFSSLLPELLLFLGSLLLISNTAYTLLSDSSSLNMALILIPPLPEKLQIVPTAYRVKATLLRLPLQAPTIWPQPAVFTPISHSPKCTLLFSQLPEGCRSMLAHHSPAPLLTNSSSSTGMSPTLHSLSL